MDSTYTLLDAINAVATQKRWVFAWFCGTLIVVGAATLLAPKTFTSEAKLFVRLGRENSSLDATATLGNQSVVAIPLTREAEINSVAEMIRSRQIFENVVDQLGADVILKKKSSTEGSTSQSSAGMVDRLMAGLMEIGVVNDLSLRERAVIRLSKDIDVQPLEQSNVIRIEFDSYDPEVAQQIVEAIVANYLAAHAQLHRNKDGLDFLADQTKRIKQTLTSSENQFELFKTNTGILDLGRNRQVVIDRLADIVNRKLEIDAKIAGVNEEIAQQKAELKSIDPSVVVQSTQGVGQDGVDGMRELFFQLEIQYADLTARYSEEHPEVQRIKTQLEDTKRIIEEAERSRVEQVLGINEVYSKTKVALIQKQGELASLCSMSEVYSDQVADLEQQLTKFNADETRFLRLQREVAIHDETFRRYSVNLEQARLDSQLQSEQMSNISLAQPASFSTKPSKPNKLINLLIAIVLGSCLGVGTAILRDYRRTILAT